MGRPEILKDYFAEGISERTIVVCAWCLPGEKVFNFFPTLRGKVNVSHGICESHKKEFIAGLNALAGKTPAHSKTEESNDN